MDLKHFIRVYDDVLDKNTCRNAIKAYHDEEPEASQKWDHDGRPSFTTLNITLEAERKEHEAKRVWVKIHNELLIAIKSYSEKYMMEVGCGNHWPPKNSLEQVRLKHYEANNHDRFDYHVDVGDHDSARRFLVLFFYLNDVEEGGETYFKDIDFTVRPKEGRLLIFPPNWMFPHAGLKPVSNDKYIVGTYLHYT